MSNKEIVIKGAAEHNLKNIDLKIPRDKFIVFTGLSGSGKSSLAFDTIYAEGQRRYVESLSSYARMFLGQMEKPKVESIEGLSPAISIDQKTTSKNPRSTVGTVTEIYDYLRLLYARVGIPHCPVCGRETVKQTVDQIVENVLELPVGTKIQILSPIVRGRKGTQEKEFEAARKSGFARVRADGNVYDLSEDIGLEKNKKHNVEIIVDRIVIKDGIKTRLADSIETASKLSGGLTVVDVVGGEELEFSESYACPDHGVNVPELEPNMFSFNNPFGACKKCSGLGMFMKINEKLVIPDRTKSVAEGAIKASGWNYKNSWNNPHLASFASMYYDGLSKHYNFSLNTPFEDLPKVAQDVLLYGTDGKKLDFKRKAEWGGGTYTTDFEGIIPNLERRYRETQSDSARAELEGFMTAQSCPECKGARLNKATLAVTVNGKNISEFCNMSVTEAMDFINGIEYSETKALIYKPILKEINARLDFLKSVGLDYLTLSRAAGTLSGGESQRIRLATQIGSSLTGVLYILDEPSIGLHQRDNERLINTLRKLRDLGNTLIVVEHDEDTMRAADYIVDIGPGAGVHGGFAVCAGTPEEVAACEKSITGAYLSGREKIPVPKERRKGNGQVLSVIKPTENNLKMKQVDIPLGMFVCVTGVSGSGKSTLVNEIVYKRLANELNGARGVWGEHETMIGLQNLDKVIEIDQAPIGKTPRSNPATYTGVFTDIRELFASTAEAKMRGYNSGRFSFNVKGGRCEACQGDGIVKIEMHFLPDVYVPCEVCGGRRYNNETLRVKYKGKSIHDVLEMTVEEGLEFFAEIPKIARKLQTIYDVGLGYVKLGQPATTLSGGEAQRVKLATELSKKATGKTVYILDEPTTGLHTADVKKLLEVLTRLVDAGNSLIVIEHNLDVIKTADYIIDLGPEGGTGGGKLVACGTPEEVAKCKKSFTGQFIKKLL